MFPNECRPSQKQRETLSSGEDSEPHPEEEMPPTPLRPMSDCQETEDPQFDI